MLVTANLACNLIGKRELLAAIGTPKDNRNHTGPYVTFEQVPFALEEVLFDPQTSGGLLLAAAPEDAVALEAELQAAGLPAKIVGEIIPKTEQEITVKY